ncbi:hypothetical protein EV715DRAFT_257643 [Schizophyllum commune]
MNRASFTAFLLAFAALARAGSQNKWESCSTGNNRLQIGTYQFYSDCNSHTYCASNGTCMPKGCRRDIFPLGYDDPDSFPPLCNHMTFCPDEEDACQPLLRVDSRCQLNRDDQCEAPPDWRKLADHSGAGRNHNGTVCLNNTCMCANRDNCKIGSYCDSQQLLCMKTKDVGESYGKCGELPSALRKLPSWVYIVIGGGTLAITVGILVGLFMLHRKQGRIEREKRLQYWRDQNALHEELKYMRENNTVFASPNASQISGIGTAYSDDSHAPILRHKGSSQTFVDSSRRAEW